MNWLDTDISKLLDKYKGKDKLEALFDLQKELMQKYGVGVKDINTKDGQIQIKAGIQCAVEELFELSNVLKNRPWTKTETLVDMNHLNDEVSDALHFFIELLILLGFDAKSLFELYLKKREVNLFRLRSEY